MVDLLRGCRAKIERANEGVNNLNNEISSFIGSDQKPYTIIREPQNNARDYVFIARLERDVPDRFAVLAGEIIHNLASSLDHLFAALVLRATNTVEKWHQFPVYTAKKEFRNACEKGAIKDVSPKAREILTAVQPCNATGNKIIVVCDYV